MHAARVGVACKTSQAVNQVAYDNTAHAQGVVVHVECCENGACWKGR